MFTCHSHQLNCGLTLLTIPMPIESVTALMLSNTGSRYEIASKQGIAHFFEHIVFKGTQKYPNALILAETIDQIGADFNAFTSKEYTGYYVKAAAKHFSLSLDVLSDMLLAPKLLQADIDREKGVIIEELNMYLDNPARHIGDLFEQKVYKGSGLSHDIIGTKKTISSITQADFQQFLTNWYDLSNMVLVLAGKEDLIQDPQTIKQVNKIFADKYQTRRARGKTKLARQANFMPNPLSNQRLHIENKATQQAHFVLGWPGLKRGSKQRFALTLLSVILGGNMSSRLFTQVREKRSLAYYVRSDVDQYHDGGIFGASAGVDKARIEEALNVTIAQFTDLVSCKQTITKTDLQKTKDYLIGKMILNFEESDVVAQTFGLKLILLEKIETPEEIIAKIKAVTTEEVLNLAHQLIKPDQLRLAVIGQFNESEKRFFESLVNI